MLTIEDIKTLIKELDSSSLSELKLEAEDGKITLRKADAFAGKVKTIVEAAPQTTAVQAPSAQLEPQSNTSAEPAAAEANTDADPSLHKITAPMVGTFYSSSSPDADAFVSKGSKVDKKSVVCIVEAMKLFNEIEADCKGTIVDVLVEDGQLVEYGQPLFLVKED
ncbi:acetyl-CoA carboxylase biotin carboxyl carrier protein [Sporolactobacillus terrae]|uniref:Biotin carboxyl carrier protein of acetyl-CoA carboxylase n=1 Tax=Sporolactobacillus terrae TaxID=269673 RepID=A0A410D9E8_9BACL|nr:acetyl-CoA carboxylase biotin carboxyl carrier protein [Sporolactobacillus terrae]QAA22729.1 acetyl-CoA carboxylase biotin carboxyl carrier protein [Sporolactobacillus terrae]QAA25702.1 acetyl-CoA carboxylase biotin carboxyl carrier protein [Sporolactobacillus terrae]UAK17515.1 acetyl-CoA carboxylase biotin carboxyl carrier protein [Sporolactobacillus terrae]BBN99063.1 biotin carboxyl carrier protein of acetyl-CoA carboxylase [Sporolactobacillus terrae]